MLAFFLALASVVGVGQQMVGTALVRSFVAAPKPEPQSRPPVSVLKPLCGVEPLLEEALEPFFALDYPDYQLVFGVQNAADPVLALVEHLRARHPARDVTLVVDATLHGTNRKVSNLINMQGAAKHELLVLSDADIHVQPDFLNRVVAALEAPGVGLVTSLYTGLPGGTGLATRLAASQINHNFLPGALLARKMGRQDGLGVTMALRAEVLAQIGGLRAVANNLADDQVLGRHIVARGLRVALAQTILATSVPEAGFTAVFHHELRWARTIRALVPVPWAASVLQISLLWAVLALLVSGFAVWGWALFVAVMVARVACARVLDKTLGLPNLYAPGLFLLRDALSTAIYIGSFTGSQVRWRGQSMRADSGIVPSR